MIIAEGPLARLVHRLFSDVEGGVHPALGLDGPRVLPAALAAAAVAVVLTRLPAPPRAAGHWSWRTTGLLVGAAGVAAWLAGAPAGWHWGLSVTGPARSLAEAAIRVQPASIGWGGAMLIGIPIGSGLAAYATGALSLRRPPSRDVLPRLAGGVLMGIGGTLAAGCNVGNALTGLSILATNSVIATGAIIAGVAIAVRVTDVVSRGAHRTGVPTGAPAARAQTSIGTRLRISRDRSSNGE